MKSLAGYLFKGVGVGIGPNRSAKPNKTPLISFEA
jgi:hypothetical protein